MKKSLMTLIVVLMTCSSLDAQIFSKNTRYKGMVELTNTSSLGKDNISSIMQVTTTHGAFYNNRLFFGVGAGISYEVSDETVIIPLFADSRYYFTNTTGLSPFVMARTGIRYNGSTTSIISPFIGIGAGIEHKHLSVCVGIDKATTIIDRAIYDESHGYIGKQHLVNNPFAISCSFAVVF
jgi:hypothetical protein